MVTFYWLLEYGKVLCGYLFLMFLWPSVVFRKYLKGKSKIFWFSFCVTGQVVLVNTVVLSLGLLHILNRWVVVGIFYGVFLWSLLKDVRFKREKIEKIQRLFLGTYGIKTFLVGDVIGGIKRGLRRFWEMIRPRFGEYLFLSIILLYGMIYFSYGAFQVYAYGASDMPVHHAWIYGLMEGQIFSGKIYPEGMHCFVYTMYALFNIPVYNIQMLLAGIHIVVFLTSAYAFFMEIFHWRYTALLVVEFFLILDLKTGIMRDSMVRLQWTIPQEFGLFTQFLCALFLIRFLKSTHHIVFKGKVSKNCWDENLLAFILSLAASIIIHFYPTIMAFLLCVSVSIFFLGKIFSKGHFIPLVSAVMGGVLIAAIPMVGAFASGIEFQGSIYWALNVMSGDEENQKEEELEETQTQEKLVLDEIKESGKDVGVKDDGVRTQNGMEMKTVTLLDFVRNVISLCQEKIKAIYNYGYISMHGTGRAKWFAEASKLVVILWVIYRVIAIVLNLRFKGRIDKKCLDGYLPLVFASFLFMTIYTGNQIGIPQLIDKTRICSSTQLLMLGVVAIPLDMFLSFLKVLFKEGIMKILSYGCSVGIYVVTIMFGNYHEYLYFFMTRYNSTVMVTNSIIETMPQHSYTIVSPTEELYPVIAYGRHEEILTFVQKCTEESYVLPTEYVFIFVEKKPFLYQQALWIHGPSWLAIDKHKNDTLDILEISQEAAQKDIIRYSNDFESYTDIESRTILESKAYEWCQRFSELYPYEMNVYYEDDDFVCYYFRQEPNAPYNLGIG